MVCLEALIGKTSRTSRTRHHMLYPKHMWQAAGSDARRLRGAFIVRLPGYLHQQLHWELDNQFEENVDAGKLPHRSTLARILENYQLNEDYVRMMGAYEKLEWLKSQLDGSIANIWLKSFIEREQAFLLNHQEEIAK